MERFKDHKTEMMIATLIAQMQGCSLKIEFYAYCLLIQINIKSRVNQDISFKTTRFPSLAQGCRKVLNLSWMSSGKSRVHLG